MKLVNENNKNGRFLGVDLGERGRIGLASQPTKQVPNFKWITVQSDMISNLGYAHKNQILLVRFSNGSIYEYADVSYSIFKDLAHAESVGKYFHTNIKNKFTTRKLEPEDY
jgi:hypothetical protein